ncbi:MAG: hypothetical protein QG588_510, partial [Candidatus Poribacteria bacterium]|nr:hypothetical protein [Candidatus Poribacteria bacterium]
DVFKKMAAAITKQVVVKLIENYRLAGVIQGGIV